MRYILIFLLAGCASRISEHDSPERKADYAQCEKEASTGERFILGGGIAVALKINECMGAKGWK